MPFLPPNQQRQSTEGKIGAMQSMTVISSVKYLQDLRATVVEIGSFLLIQISSKQPKSYLLLTFRPISEAFIRRSWH